MDVSQIGPLGESLRENIERVLIGKTGEIKLVLAALLAGGHVLLEDVPGTGKTVLAKALARSIDIGFRRVQFTPDLLPSELTGLNVYNPKSGEFSFRQGSLFTNILLADEINRATPRTQSGLLESMEERQVSVDGKTWTLPAPYFVIATQNPVETQGTFPLPEAQLDRFLIQLRLGYPNEEESVQVLRRFISGGDVRTAAAREAAATSTTAPASASAPLSPHTDTTASAADVSPDVSPLDAITPVCGAEELRAAIEATRRVYVHDEVFRYIVRIAEATRAHEAVTLGVSTRGCIALARLAQARVALDGRAFATPDDIVTLLPAAFAHRLILRGGRQSVHAARVLSEIADSVPPPVEDWRLDK